MKSTENANLNLIPRERTERRKRMQALRRMGAMCAICAFLSGLPLVAVLAAPEATQSILSTKSEKNIQQISLNQQTNEELKNRLSKLNIQAQSVSMLERRIDWGGILQALSFAAQDDVWFDQIKGGVEETGQSDRVEIEIRGYASSQGTARVFVVALEQLGVFDEIVLNETSRVMIRDADYVQFRILLAVDPALEEKEGK